MMQYTDRLYATFEINAPVLLDLINSHALKRLQGVDQAGYFEPHFPGMKFSRFEHSLGVSLLLRRFEASLEEQVAGLIHDVSHSVFSHCIDYVPGRGSPQTHSHQDDIFTDFIKASEIPAILERHGLDSAYIMDDRKHTLKERELPDLCADRLDYSLRQALVAEETTLQELQQLIDSLTVRDGYWVFMNQLRAQEYAELFARLNTKYWAGLNSAVMFHTVGSYLGYALDRHYISASDLFTTDRQVLDKLGALHGGDSVLRSLFDRMTCRTEYFENRNNNSVRVFCKSRVVDPLCETARGIRRLSHILPAWENVLKKESKPKEYYISFHDSLPPDPARNI